MSVKCCYYDVSELADSTLFSKAMDAITCRDRIEKVNRYKFDKDKRLCLGAGLLAETMLKQAGADNISIIISQHGKPILADRSDIHFNLSHDGTLAVCAVSDSPVGVDVQKKTAYNPAVAKRVFKPCEIEWADICIDKDEAFTRLWARKESYVKFLGRGLLQDTSTFSVVPGNESCKDVCFTEFTVGDYLICVCCSKGETVTFDKFNSFW